MFDTRSLKENYIAGCTAAGQRCIAELEHHVERRGYRMFNDYHRASSVVATSSAYIYCYLASQEEPDYWFRFDFCLVSLDWYHSSQSSHRGKIRVNKADLDSFLDEMDHRKLEWIRGGKQRGKQSV